MMPIKMISTIMMLLPVKMVWKKIRESWINSYLPSLFHVLWDTFEEHQAQVFFVSKGE